MYTRAASRGGTTSRGGIYRMATFVLVHGAWHGGWCWRRVAPALRAAGHTVYAPTLTGLGERIHQANRSVDLSTRTTDIVNVLDYEDVTGAPCWSAHLRRHGHHRRCGPRGNRISHLVFVDAFLPVPGQSLHDLIGPEAAAARRSLADQHGEGLRVPPIIPLFGLTDWRTTTRTAPGSAGPPLHVAGCRCSCSSHQGQSDRRAVVVAPRAQKVGVSSTRAAAKPVGPPLRATRTCAR